MKDYDGGRTLDELKAYLDKNAKHAKAAGDKSEL
jgi:hypothetical protein